MWVRFILGGERVGLVRAPLAYYRKRPGSVTAEHWRTRGRGRTGEAVLEKVLQRPDARSIPGVEASLLLARAFIRAGDGEYATARRMFRAAARSRDLHVSNRLQAAVRGILPSAVSDDLVRALRSLRSSASSLRR
jgi:hypothetical protein